MAPRYTSSKTAKWTTSGASVLSGSRLKNVVGAFVSVVMLSCGARSGLESLAAGSGASATLGTGGRPKTGRFGVGGEAGVPVSDEGGSSGLSGGLDGSIDVPDATDFDAAGPPLCALVQGSLDSLDIWSDGSGPFVLVSTTASGIRVLHRANGHWSTYYRQATEGGASLFVRGRLDDNVLVYGSLRCGIVAIHEGVGDCSAGLEGLAGGLFVVSETQAYGLQLDQIISYSPATRQWSQFADLVDPLGGSFNGFALWADADMIAATDDAGHIVLSTGPAASFVDETPPTPTPFPVVWGLANDVLWYGGAKDGTLLARSGSQWSAQGTVVDSCGAGDVQTPAEPGTISGPGIKGFWGAGSTLFIRTDHRVVRRDGSVTQNIMQLPCTRHIRGMWGGSPSEVYVAVENTERGGASCGAAEVYLVTGSEVSLI